MKKKAAIFTWCHNCCLVNYGQILQCYATQELCKEYGLDVIVINYRNLKKFEKADDIPPKGRERDCYEKLFVDKYVERQDDIQVKRFVDFISANIRLSQQCYSIKDIKEEILDKDILIVGSDQLWNPLWFDPVYLLEFVETRQRCVSVATGGISSNKEVYSQILKRIAKGVERFDFVSVRESISRDILNSYTNKKIVDILDPTLMLGEDKWKVISQYKLIEGKYIFVYCLGKITPHKHILKEIARKYKTRKIVYIRMHYSSEQINNEGILEPVVDAGPREFLSLIRYASAVCTDSFHGFALSLVFRKDYYLLDRAYIARDEASNVRADNIMNKLKIPKRYANSKKELLKLESIDYEGLRTEFDKRKNDSIKEFERAIGCI